MRISCGSWWGLSLSMVQKVSVPEDNTIYNSIDDLASLGDKHDRVQLETQVDVLYTVFTINNIHVPTNASRHTRQQGVTSTKREDGRRHKIIKSRCSSAIGQRCLGLALCCFPNLLLDQGLVHGDMRMLPDLVNKVIIYLCTSTGTTSGAFCGRFRGRFFVGYIWFNTGRTRRDPGFTLFLLITRF